MRENGNLPKESFRSIEEMYGIIAKSWEMIREEVDKGLSDAKYDLIDDATNLVYMCTSVMTCMEIFFKENIERADLESLHDASSQVPPSPSISSLNGHNCCLAETRLVLMRHQLDKIVDAIMASKHQCQCPYQFKVEGVRS